MQHIGTASYFTTWNIKKNKTHLDEKTEQSRYVKNKWKKVSSGQRAVTRASTQSMSQLLPQRKTEDKQWPYIRTGKEELKKKRPLENSLCVLPTKNDSLAPWQGLY